MNEARDLIQYLTENMGQIPKRDAYQGIEALQAYQDELDALIENLPPADVSVTVKAQCQGLKFASVEKMAEWLEGWRSWK